jgi:hypothetical protein
MIKLRFTGLSAAVRTRESLTEAMREARRFYEGAPWPDRRDTKAPSGQVH